MTAFQKKIRRFVKRSPLGPPLRTAWRRLRRFANRKPALSLTRKPIDERKAEITKHATYRLQDFLISGQTLPFPQADQPIISVVLVLFNRAELTFRCLRSLKENTHLPIEIIVIDNRSTDLTERLFRQVTGVRYVRNIENKHFLRGTNQGAQLARGKYLLLLNSDTELTPGSIEVALNALESDPSLGAVGGRLILPDGTLQEAGCFVWDDGTCQGYGRGDDPTAGPYMFPRLVDFCSGAFLLTPRSLWDELGGLDEAFVPAYYEEADYCMRLWKAGRPVRYEPRAAVWHFEFASSQSSAAPRELMLEHQKVFASRHAEALRNRPRNRSVPDVLMRSRSLVRKPRVLIYDEWLPHLKSGAGYPRANRMIHTLLDLGCEVSCLPAGYVDPSENWVTIAEDIPLAAEILAFEPYGPDGVSKVWPSVRATMITLWSAGRRPWSTCTLFCPDILNGSQG